MEDSVKHKLIGAAILLMVTAWLLPMLFQAPDDILNGSAISNRQAIKIPKPMADSSLILPELMDSSEFIEKKPIAKVNLTKVDKKPSRPHQLPVEQSQAKVSHTKKIVSTAAHKAKPQPIQAHKNLSSPKHSKIVTHAKPKKVQAKVVASKARYQKHKLQPNEQFVLQVASMSNGKQALVLKKRLQRQGFITFIRRSKGKKGRPLTRLYVGVRQSRGSAWQLQQRLKKASHLNSIIVHHPDLQVKRMA